MHDTGHSDAVRALAVANDRLFSGSYDGTVKVWDVKSMECLQTLAGHTGPVRTLVYSGGHMFSGSYDKTVSHCTRCSLSYFCTTDPGSSHAVLERSLALNAMCAGVAVKLPCTQQAEHRLAQIVSSIRLCPVCL